MKMPTSVKLDDQVGDDPVVTTTVIYSGCGQALVTLSFDDSNDEFGLTRAEVRKLRNFLNKCLEY